MPVFSARTVSRAQLTAHIAALLLLIAAVLAAGYARAQDALAPVPPVTSTTAPATAYMVELADPPAAAVLAAAGSGLSTAAAAAATQAQVAQVAAAQATVTAHLAALDTPVLYATQRVYNGIAVLADAEQVAAIAALPGVVAVHPLVPKRPDNATSVPFLGIPTLWQGGALPALHGEGIRIGIIDTGIDYLHVDFGGPGGGYGANDPTRLGDVASYPGVKVIGGYDFAGDTYNADAAADAAKLVPQPDPDPMDCYGHGTHVAGTAAGYGVTAAGTAYAGPYGAGLDFSSFAIGPGMAPAAQVYALKIFGCTGSSNLTEAALEWAVDPNRDGDFADHLDVVNLSLGSPYGAPYDTSAVAADNAAAAGVIVVASAGNSGNTNLVVGTPSVADRAISVAASQHHLATTAVSAGDTALGGDTGADFTARGPRRGDAALKPDVAAPGVNIVSASALSGAGRYTASGTSMAAPHVAGFMALLRQLHPDWSVEELKALAMNTAMPYVRTAEDLAATPYTPVRTGAGRIEPRAAVLAETVAYAAPGTGRVGLSFGSPEVADSYADTRLVRLDNKGAQVVTYTVAYNSLVNTPGVTVLPPSGPLSVGPGGSAQFAVGLQIDGATLRRVQSAVDQASIASGAWLPEESGHLFLWPAEPPAQLTLGGGVAATLRYDPPRRTLSYTLTLDGLTPSQLTGASIGLDQVGGDSGQVAVLPLADGAVSAGPELTGTVVLDGRAERWLAAGWLRLEVRSPALTDGAVSAPIAFAQPVLHLPVYAGPRPVAAMRAHPAELVLDEAGVQVLALGGQALTGSTPPTDVVSLAAVTQLQLRSPNSRPSSMPAGAATGAQDGYDQADIKYVGIASDLTGAAAGKVEDATLYFALATWAPWTTPNEVQFNVRIDVDGDGKSDYRLYNLDRATFNGNRRGDAFVAVLENVKTGKRAIQAPINGVEPASYDTAPYFADVLLLPVKASALGLAGGKSQFTYYVDTTSIDVAEDTVTRVDLTPRLSYDVAQPLLTAAGPLAAGPLVAGPLAAGPLRADQPDTEVLVRLDLRAYATQPNPALLVVHLHNRVGEKAEVVEVGYTWPYAVRLPWVARH